MEWPTDPSDRENRVAQLLYLVQSKIGTSEFGICRSDRLVTIFGSHQTFKPACIEAGAYCERVDEQIFNENILERVYNEIAKADIIIAEMTGRNPNVFYETGYAHALDQTVILLTQNAEDIPFDLRQYPHIVYGGKITYIKKELERRVRWFIAHPDDTATQRTIEDLMEFAINTLPVKDNPTIEIPWRYWVRKRSDPKDKSAKKDKQIEFILTLSVHNISGQRLSILDRYGFAFMTPHTFTTPFGLFQRKNRVIVSPGLARTKVDLNGILLPDDWLAESVEYGAARPFSNKEKIDCKLLVFSAIERYEYPFKIQFQAKEIGEYVD